MKEEFLMLIILAVGDKHTRVYYYTIVYFVHV